MEATKILYEQVSPFGDRQIEQDGDCLVLHIYNSHEHKTQVWDIKIIKEAISKAETPA